MRSPRDLPRPSYPTITMSRGRVAMIVVAVGLFFLLISIRGIARLYTDYLWFESVDQSEVWKTVLGTKMVLGLLFTSVFFALIYLNLWIADRSAAPFVALGPEEEILERFHEAIEDRRTTARIGVSLFFALISGAGMSALWNEWILFTNAVDFGVKDPQFGYDIGFFVFSLPLLAEVVDWLFASLVIVISAVLAMHYVNGSIRLQVPVQGTLPHVKAHVSLLLAVLALVKAADYWLARFELTTSTRGVVNGATYTDVNVQLPALYLLVAVAITAAGVFVYNIHRKGWVLPVIVASVWAIVHFVALYVNPAFVQRFRVEPDESARERPFIEHNIAATRAAFGLDDVETEPFAYTEDLDATAQALADNELSVRNIRLVDPFIATDTYTQLQAAVGFWRFPSDLDVDRYEVDGEPTAVVLAARGLDPNGLPQKSWEGRHVRFTHGYGLALAPANGTTGNGRPDFRISGAPVSSRGIDAPIQDPQIYVGEGLGGYAIVSTERDEVDYVDGENNTQTYRYSGDAGVSIGSMMRRAAFALRFGSIDPLVSGLVRTDSRIIYLRDIRERVSALAPFLSLDHDPYPVIVDGRIVFVLDAYTTSSRYPYSQTGSTEGLSAESGLRHGFNYVRSSVKITVDSFDGTVRFYVLPDEMSGGDPIIRAYRRALPSLFSDYEDMPDTIKDHLRYPEDLFRVQTNMWGRYHIEDPDAFYSPATGWSVAQDPGSGVEGGSATAVTNEEGEKVSTREARISPNYQLLRLPGDQDESFVLLRPFVPVSENDERKQLSAFMTAASDEDEYGRLRVFELPPNRANGPAIVSSNIRSNTEVSAELTLLSQQGSAALFGDQQLIPIGTSLLHVRPLYVQAEGETAVPELRKVIVAFGDQIVMRDTLREALQAIFGVEINTREAFRSTGEDGDPPDPDDDDDGDGDGDDGGPTTTGGSGSPTTTDPDAPTTTRPETSTTTDPGTPPTSGPFSGMTVEELLQRADELFLEADEALADGDLVRWAEKVTEARMAVSAAAAMLDEQATPPSRSL